MIDRRDNVNKSIVQNNAPERAVATTVALHGDREPTRPKPRDAISQQYENVSSVNIIAGNFAASATHVLVHGRHQLSDFLILLLHFDRSVALPNYCWRKLVALIRPPSRNHVIFALFKCNNFTVSQERDNQTPNSEKIKSCDFS